MLAAVLVEIMAGVQMVCRWVGQVLVGMRDLTGVVTMLPKIRDQVVVGAVMIIRQVEMVVMAVQA